MSSSSSSSTSSSIFDRLYSKPTESSGRLKCPKEENNDSNIENHQLHRNGGGGGGQIPNNNNGTTKKSSNTMKKKKKKPVGSSSNSTVYDRLYSKGTASCNSKYSKNNSKPQKAEKMPSFASMGYKTPAVVSIASGTKTRWGGTY